MSFVKTIQWKSAVLRRCRSLKTWYLKFLIMQCYFFFQEIYSKYVTPLQPIAKEPLPYVSKHTVSQPLSPYYLSNNDSRKNFMSGISKLTNSLISLNVGIKINLYEMSTACYKDKLFPKIYNDLNTLCTLHNEYF